jgi:ankyrin repeat protein
VLHRPPNTAEKKARKKKPSSKKREKDDDKFGLNTERGAKDFVQDKMNAPGVERGARHVSHRMAYQSGPFKYEHGVYNGGPLKFVNDPTKPNFRNEYTAPGVLSPYKARAVGSPNSADDSSDASEHEEEEELSQPNSGVVKEQQSPDLEELKRGRIGRDQFKQSRSRDGRGRRSRSSRSRSRSKSPPKSKESRSSSPDHPGYPPQGSLDASGYAFDKHGGVPQGQYFMGKQHREPEVNEEIDAVMRNSLGKDFTSPAGNHNLRTSQASMGRSVTFEEEGQDGGSSHRPRASIEAWSPTPSTNRKSIQSTGSPGEDSSGGGTHENRPAPHEDDAALVSLSGDEPSAEKSAATTVFGGAEGSLLEPPLVGVSFDAVHSACSGVLAMVQQLATKQNMRLTRDLKSEEEQRRNTLPSFIQAWREATLEARAHIEYKEAKMSPVPGSPSGSGVPGGSPGVRLSATFGPVTAAAIGITSPAFNDARSPVMVEEEPANRMNMLRSPVQLTPTRMSHSSLGPVGTGRHTASRGMSPFRERVGPTADLSPRDDYVTGGGADERTSSGKKKKQQQRGRAHVKHQAVEAERLATPTGHRTRVKVQADPLDMVEVDKRRSSMSPAERRRSSRSQSKSKSPGARSRSKSKSPGAPPKLSKHQQHAMEDLWEGSPTRVNTRLSARRSPSPDRGASRGAKRSPKSPTEEVAPTSPPLPPREKASPINTGSVPAVSPGADDAGDGKDQKPTPEAEGTSDAPATKARRKKKVIIKKKKPSKTSGDNDSASTAESAAAGNQKSIEESVGEKDSHANRIAAAKQLVIDRKKHNKKAAKMKVAAELSAKARREPSPETNRRKQMQILTEVEKQVRQLEEAEKKSAPQEKQQQQQTTTQNDRSAQEETMKQRIDSMADNKSPRSKSHQEHQILSEMQSEVQLLERDLEQAKESSKESSGASSGAAEEKANDDSAAPDQSDNSTAGTQVEREPWQHNGSDYVVDTKTLTIYSKEGDPVGHWDGRQPDASVDLNDSQQQNAPRNPLQEGWVWFHVWTVDDEMHQNQNQNQNQPPPPPPLEDISAALLAATHQPHAQFHGLVTLPHTPVSLLAAWTSESLPGGLMGSEFEKHHPDSQLSSDDGGTIDEDDNAALVNRMVNLAGLLQHGLVTSVKLCQEPSFLADAQEAASRGVHGSVVSVGGEPSLSAYPHGGNLSSGGIQPGPSYRTLNSESQEGSDDVMAPTGLQGIGAFNGESGPQRPEGCPLVEVIADWSRSEADDYDQQYISSAADGEEGDGDIDRSTGGNVDILEHATVGQRLRLLNTFANGWAFCVHVEGSVALSENGAMNRSSTGFGHSLNRMGYIPLDRLSAVIQEPVMESTAGSALLGPSLYEQPSGTPVHGQPVVRVDRRVDFEPSNNHHDDHDHDHDHHYDHPHVPLSSSPAVNVDVAVPQDALLEHARYLGLDWDENTSLAGPTQQALCALVEESIKAPLPMGWEVADSANGSKGSNASYVSGPFINTWTQQKSSEHPLDRYYRQKIANLLGSGVRDNNPDVGGGSTTALQITESQVGVQQPVSPALQKGQPDSSSSNNNNNEWYFVEHAWSPNTPQRLASTQDAPLLSIQPHDGPVRVLSRNDETGWWWCEVDSASQEGANNHNNNNNNNNNTTTVRGYLPGQYLRPNIVEDPAMAASAPSAVVGASPSFSQSMSPVGGGGGGVGTSGAVMMMPHQQHHHQQHQHQHQHQHPAGFRGEGGDDFVQRAERALFRAVASGNMRAIATAVSNGASADRALNASAHPPLVHAALRTAPSKLRAVVAYLVRQGADLDRCDAGRDAMPPLHHAARAGRSGACATLLEAGASVDAADHGGVGLTALQHAVSSGAIECAQLLLERKADVEAMAALSRRADSVEASQSVGSHQLDGGDGSASSGGGGGNGGSGGYLRTPNASDDGANNSQEPRPPPPQQQQQQQMTRTPLLEVVSSQALNVELARVLIDAGANVLAKDASNSDASVVHLLASHCVPASRHAMGGGGAATATTGSYSPGASASKHKRSPGAPEATSGDGGGGGGDDGAGEGSPQQQQQQQQHMAILGGVDLKALEEDAEERLALLGEVLMREPAALHVTDHYGNTALHWAVYYDAPDAARCLLEQGADADAANAEGQTPVDLASPEAAAALGWGSS